MDNNGYCKYCPKNCHWTKHKNVPYIFTITMIEKENVLDDLKKDILIIVINYQRVNKLLEKKY